MKFPKSKKGDIPTFILVIGVFLVCALTVISLTISFASVEKGFNVLQSMVSVNSIADQIRFYENAGLDPKNLLDIDKEGNYYVIISESLDNKERVFYVEYRIPAKSTLPK